MYMFITQTNIPYNYMCFTDSPLRETKVFFSTLTVANKQAIKVIKVKDTHEPPPRILFEN